MKKNAIGFIIIIVLAIVFVLIWLIGSNSKEPTNESHSPVSTPTEVILDVPDSTTVSNVTHTDESISYEEPVDLYTPEGDDLLSYCSNDCKVEIQNNVPTDVLESYNTLLYDNYATDVFEFVSYSGGVLVLYSSEYTYTFNYCNGEPYVLQSSN